VLNEQQLQDAAAQLEQGLEDWKKTVPAHIRDVIISDKALGEQICM
jgi:hypothetical protein